MIRHAFTLKRLFLREPYYASEWVQRIYTLLRRLILRDAQSIQSHSEWLCGRRVALVGNAQSLMDAEFCSSIDSMDLVLRMNHGVILRPVSQGLRTDILAMSCRMSESELIRQFNPTAIFWMTPRWWHILTYSREVM